LTRPEFVDWDDADYKGLSCNMKEMALKAKAAVVEGDYNLARKSAKSVSQACSACHADFR
jgi:cytochrome c556